MNPNNHIADPMREILNRFAPEPYVTADSLAALADEQRARIKELADENTNLADQLANARRDLANARTYADNLRAQLGTGRHQL